MSSVLGHPGVGDVWVWAHQVVDGLTVIVMESRTSQPPAPVSEHQKRIFSFFRAEDDSDNQN